MRLAGRTAIVTGAGSGIGRASAVLFAKEGAFVALVDRDRAGLQETLTAIVGAKGEASLHVGDVSDADFAKDTASDAVKILEAGRSAAEDDAEKLNFGVALLSAYNNLEEYQKLDALATDLAKQFPESKRLFFENQIARRALGRFAEADALAQEMTKRLPDDTDVRRAFIYTAAAREDRCS